MPRANARRADQGHPVHDTPQQAITHQDHEAGALATSWLTRWRPTSSRSYLKAAVVREPLSVHGLVYNHGIVSIESNRSTVGRWRHLCR